MGARVSGGGIEQVGWLFMRLSGLALIFLALGHFAIQHVINDVHNLSLDFVARRWAMLGWRIYDALLLLLALLHGLNGLRTILTDYTTRPGVRRGLQVLFFALGILIAIVGVIALIGGVRIAT